MPKYGYIAYLATKNRIMNERTDAVVRAARFSTCFSDELTTLHVYRVMGAKNEINQQQLMSQYHYCEQE